VIPTEATNGSEAEGPALSHPSAQIRVPHPSRSLTARRVGDIPSTTLVIPTEATNGSEAEGPALSHPSTQIWVPHPSCCSREGWELYPPPHLSSRPKRPTGAKRRDLHFRIRQHKSGCPILRACCSREGWELCPPPHLSSRPKRPTGAKRRDLHFRIRQHKSGCPI